MTWQAWCLENDFVAPSLAIWKTARTFPVLYDLEAPEAPKTRNGHKKVVYYARNESNGLVTRYASYEAFCRVIGIAKNSFHLLLRIANEKGRPLHGYRLWKEHETPPVIVKPVKSPITLRHGIRVEHFHSQTEAENDLGLPRGCISRILKARRKTLPLGWFVVKEEGA